MNFRLNHQHTFKIQLLLSIIILLTLSCKSISNSETKVINGLVAKESQATYTVLIGRNNYMCSAAFIKPSVALTAAHCVIDRKDGYRVATPNELSFRGVKAEKIFIADEQNAPAIFKKAIERADRESIIEFVKRDIALILFPENTATNHNIQTTSLKSITNTKPTIGDKIFIIGFGRASDDDASSGGIKRWGTNKISEATDSYFGYPSASGNTPGKNSGAASGDSGGPILYVKDQSIIGVTSWGFRGTERAPNLTSEFARELMQRADLDNL